MPLTVVARPRVFAGKLNAATRSVTDYIMNAASTDGNGNTLKMHEDELKGVLVGSVLGAGGFGCVVEAYGLDSTAFDRAHRSLVRRNP